jgi:D-ribose pyranase
MKKTTLLQSALSYTIATLGHLDMIVIADAGLSIPAETVRIDLALTQGVPGATQTLKVVLEEMKVEKVILAEEAKDRNPKFLRDVQKLLPGVLVEYLTHAELKAMTKNARAVVRTGEFSPYATMILVSGVVF